MASEFKYVGKPMTRRGAPSIVTGKAVYTQDICLGHMLHAKVLRSPHPHAKIKSIDTSKAEALPGVGAVLTYKDFASAVDFAYLNPYIIGVGVGYMITDEPTYVGEIVAAVAAETEDMAEDALDLIEVEYEVLPAVFDMDEAIKPDATLVAPRRRGYTLESNRLAEASGRCVHNDVKYSTIEEGFREADEIVETEYRNPIEVHAALEKSGAIAQWVGDELVIYSTAQASKAVLPQVTTVLGIPNNKARIISPPYVGGAFGGKDMLEFLYISIAAVLAKRAGMPVKFTLTMPETMTAHYKRYPQKHSVKIGVKKDGALTALKGNILIDTGAWTVFPMLPLVPLHMVCPTYRWPHLDVTVDTVYTNNEMSGAMRTWVVVETHWNFNQYLDEAAEASGVDPIEFHLKNISRDGDKLVSMHGDQERRGGRPDLMLEMVAEKSRFKDKWKGWKTPVEVNGYKRKGIGIATASGPGVIGPIIPAASSAVAWLDATGKLFATMTGGELGQGITTAMPQWIGEVMNMPPENVTLLNDTALPGVGQGTVAQMGTTCGISSAKLAAEELRKELLERAEVKLGIPADELDMEDEVIFEKNNPDNKIAFGALILEPGAAASGVKTPIGIGWAVATKFDPVKQVMLLNNSHHVASLELEVDIETGGITFLDLVAGAECGRVINPTLVDRQILGGALMGLNYGLNGELVRDRMTHKILNGTYLEYKVLTIMDMPEKMSTIVDDDPANAPLVAGNLGSKGLGEGTEAVAPTTVPIAVYNATGVRIRDGAASPDKILQALGKG